MTALFGSGMWGITIPTPNWVFSFVGLLDSFLGITSDFHGITLTMILMIGPLIMYIYNKLYMCMCVYVYILNRLTFGVLIVIVNTVKESENKLQSLSYLIPIIILIYLQMLWYNTALYTNYTIIVLFISGLASCLITVTIIVFSQARVSFV